MTNPISIIPQPQLLRRQTGLFVLKSKSTITWQGEGAGEVAGLLAEYLRPATGFKLPVEERDGGTIHLRASGIAVPDEAGFVDEQYYLTVSESGVRLEAVTATGLARGIQSLRQLFPAAIFAASVRCSSGARQLADPRNPHRKSHDHRSIADAGSVRRYIR